MKRIYFIQHKNPRKVKDKAGCYITRYTNVPSQKDFPNDATEVQAYEQVKREFGNVTVRGMVTLNEEGRPEPLPSERILEQQLPFGALDMKACQSRKPEPRPWR